MTEIEELITYLTERDKKHDDTFKLVHCYTEYHNNGFEQSIVENYNLAYLLQEFVDWKKAREDKDKKPIASDRETYEAGDHEFVDGETIDKKFGYWCIHCGAMMTSLSVAAPCVSTPVEVIEAS